jgi:hypothetical protein
MSVLGASWKSLSRTGNFEESYRELRGISPAPVETYENIEEES